MTKTNFLKSAYTDFGQENSTNLIEYLKTIGGKSLSTNCKRQSAFKFEWNQKEIRLLNRCHIQNAVDYLTFIESCITKNQIKVVIADIANYVNYLDSNEDISFVLLSTNTQLSAVQFNNAERLFYKHQIGEHSQNNYSTDILTLYALRLSLESRVRGLLGIDYATIRGKYVGLSTLIKMSKGLNSVEYGKKVDWTEIEWVNNWLNHFMHRHLRPYPWIIHQAIQVLKPFINPKELLIKSNRTIRSFFNATYVNDESELEKEIESTLKEIDSEVKIKWQLKREIVKP